MRFFHDFYGIFALTDQLSLTLGFDIGTEEQSPTGNGTNTWYSPAGILAYKFNNKWSVAGRAEYYNDKNGVIIGTGTPNGFQTWGMSINADYAIRSNAVWRIEAKTYNSKDNIFVKGDQGITSGSTVLVTSLAVSF